MRSLRMQSAERESSLHIHQSPIRSNSQNLRCEVALNATSRHIYTTVGTWSRCKSNFASRLVHGMWVSFCPQVRRISRYHILYYFLALSNLTDLDYPTGPYTHFKVREWVSEWLHHTFNPSQPPPPLCYSRCFRTEPINGRRGIHRIKLIKHHRIELQPLYMLAYSVDCVLMV
jgi:hypothetical protein